MKLLVPDHPVFNTPNKLTADDWAGWVQERGRSFLETKDARYVDLIEMEDPFEFNKGPKRGVLVEARMGKGRWVYVGARPLAPARGGRPGRLPAAGEPAEPAGRRGVGARALTASRHARPGLGVPSEARAPGLAETITKVGRDFVDDHAGVRSSLRSETPALRDEKAHREALLRVDPLLLHPEPRGARERVDLGERVLVRVLGVDPLALRELDRELEVPDRDRLPTACSRGASGSGRGPVVVRGDVAERSTSKPPPSSRLIRASRFRLNRAVTPRASS